MPNALFVCFFDQLYSSFFVADDLLGLSFQLASLEENASVYLWVMCYSLVYFSLYTCLI